MDKRSEYLYTPLFCEENIWHLARELVDNGIDPAVLQVILISNTNKHVVLFNQQRAGEQGYVLWDYHVVLRRRDAEGDRIYDFDTLLPFPCSSHDYLDATFGDQHALIEAVRAQLRVIPAIGYLQHFCSDRSHMRGVIPAEEFPTWPIICPLHEQVIRLDEYWDMDRELADGSAVYNLEKYMELADLHYTAGE